MKVSKISLGFVNTVFLWLHAIIMLSHQVTKINIMEELIDQWGKTNLIVFVDNCCSIHCMVMQTPRFVGIVSSNTPTSLKHISVIKPWLEFEKMQ